MVWGRWLLCGALMLPLAALADQQRFTAEGSSAKANLTPEQARYRAREAALAEIVNQGAGVRVRDEVVQFNNQGAIFRRVSSRNARVVDAQCDYRESDTEWRARCSGVVLRFGEQAAVAHGRLQLLEPTRRECGAVARGDVAQDVPLPTFRSRDRFCLYLTVTEPLHVAVFGLFVDQQGVQRINQVFPLVGSSVAIAPTGGNPFTPIAAAPLPGQPEALEQLLVVVSRRAEVMQLGNHHVGDSAVATLQSATTLQGFERLLQAMDLAQINLLTLPYRVVD
jgi:hypothetical protein